MLTESLLSQPNQPQPPLSAPPTEGIKYFGSKQKLLPHILSLASKVTPKTVLDGFAGTTRVSQAFASSGYQVVANDVSAWSATFASCYLLNKFSPDHYRPIIAHLNNLPPVDGWFTEHYGGDLHDGSSVGADGLKKPWQRKNTRRLDAIRNEIDQMNLSMIEKSVLITSLIRSLDEVDSTLGHYASYLNAWSPRSYKDLELKVPLIRANDTDHAVYQGDIFRLLPEVEVDLAYFDPLYGSNNDKMPASRVRYGAYYHVWTTIVLNDQPPIFGKANRRSDTSDTVSPSVFEEFRRNEAGQLIAVEAIRTAIASVRARHVILSYSSGGRATAQELHDVISENGKLLEIIELDYKRNVMATMRWTNEWVREAEAPNKEFIFLLEKR